MACTYTKTNVKRCVIMDIKIVQSKQGRKFYQLTLSNKETYLQRVTVDKTKEQPLIYAELAVLDLCRYIYKLGKGK